MDDAVHFARQPILDIRGSVFGFELLYRATAGADTCTEPDDQATARVLIDALLSIGFDALTDGRPAFINFTTTTLLSDVAMQVPPSQLAIEIIETVPITQDVIDACRRLHERGYALGLDDFVPDSPAEALLPYVSFIKMDVLQTPTEALAAVATRMRPKGIRLIAEKVETREMQQSVHALGYQWFQGFYYCRPSGLSTKAVSPQQQTYLRLLAALAREAYRTLGLQSYFTAGEKEVRAWTVPVGATAPQAAGVIHSDFEAGFIRAEIYTLADLEQFKSEKEIRAAGKLRVEGKSYVMQDGDICHFLFNV